jgi:hypothetical protein
MSHTCGFYQHIQLAMIGALKHIHTQANCAANTLLDVYGSALPI